MDYAGVGEQDQSSGRVRDMNCDLEPRMTAIEQDGIWWWIYCNGQKIAKTTDQKIAKKLAQEFKDNGFFEVDCYD